MKSFQTLVVLLKRKVLLFHLNSMLFLFLKLTENNPEIDAFLLLLFGTTPFYVRCVTKMCFDKMFFCSDGSGPKKSSPGRAQALNVKLGPGPGLSPSLKAGPRAGPGGLAGLSLLLINPKNINFTQNSSKVKFLKFYQNA